MESNNSQLKYAVNFVEFVPQKVRDGKKPLTISMENAYTPEVGKVHSNVIILNQDKFERANVVLGNDGKKKCKKIANAEVKSKEKEARLRDRINAKYHDRDTSNR